MKQQLNTKQAVSARNQDVLMKLYADLLIQNTAKIPRDIDPRNDRHNKWNKAYKLKKLILYKLINI